jgi:hypothetical protein
MQSTYETFYKMFMEMPMNISGGNSFDAQQIMLQSNLDSSHSVKVDNNIYKYSMGQQTTYWHGSPDATAINIIVDTETSGNFCKVVLTSKNPDIPKSSPPFASDMYLKIADDVKTKNLVFTSDGIVSDDAVKLWSRLTGDRLSVYDKSTKEYVLSPVDNADHLKQYLGGFDKERYVFVLSESSEFATGVRHSIGLMELKRRSNYPLAEIFDRYQSNY